MKVLVFGASGLIGSNCMEYFVQKKLFCNGTHFNYVNSNTLYFNALNINDPQNNCTLLQETNYDVFVVCNALTNVDYCEQNETESYLQTVETIKNIIQIAQPNNTKIVYLSTDYLFDGKEGPYTESATINPINIYGRHKLLAEEAVQQYSTSSLIIRVTNVYGKEDRNKNFVNRLMQNTEFKELHLPIDQYATPINAWDIARAIFLLITSGKNGVYHLGGNDYYSRYQLASRIKKKLSKNNYKLIPATTSSLLQIAPRPLKGGLLPYKFCLEYPEFTFSNIDDYLINTQL